FPGYSYFPNPTAATAPAPSAPPVSGAERGTTTYYDYASAAAAAHAAAQQQQQAQHQHQAQQQQQQQQAQATVRPEQAVHSSPLHRHHTEPHVYQQHVRNPNVTQRKQTNVPPMPRINRHQQMMLRSELFTTGGISTLQYSKTNIEGKLEIN
ncbi:hypothetical protein C0J52_28328, partial [Blattella germanica]